MVFLALELVGPWVVLGFSVGMEAFDELLSINVPNWLKAQHSENEDHGIWSHHFMGNRWGNSGTVSDFILGGLQNHCRW